MRIEPLFTEAEIEARIRELSARIYRDYADSPLVILCIAEGAHRFVDALMAEREQARAEKDWARADEIRDQLLAQGIVIEDTPTGPRWRRE